MIQTKPNRSIQVNRNGHNSRKQVSEQSPSQYPSSLQSSQLIMGQKRSRIEQLSEDQQQIVSNYLVSVQRKELKQLLIERDKLLGELHSINSHLNEMIDQLYGDLQISPNEKSSDINSLNQSSLIKPQKEADKQRQNKSNVQQAKKVENLSEQQLIALQIKNQKLIQSLQNQLADFEFMLTGQYVDQLDQEILKSQTLKKQLQYEVTFMDKSINKYTKAFDKQNIAKLQKYTYDTQIQLTQLNKKLEARLLKLNSLSTQIQQKSTKIQALTNEQTDLDRLLQMYEDEQYEDQQTCRKKKENYDKLQTKKQKLEKIINSYNNNHLKLYNKKLCDFRNIDQKISLLQQTIKQMDYKLVLASRERKQFQIQNKDALGTHKHFSSLVSNQSRKPTLKLGQTPNSQNKRSLADNKPPEDNSVSKRNRLRFVRPSLNKQASVEAKQTQNQSFYRQKLEKSRLQNDVRRRIYTELQSSHYFASLQKNNSSKSIQPLENVDSKAKENHKRKELLNEIQEKQIFIPTSDKQIIRIQSKLNARNSKLHQKKFNLSNTPLSINPKSSQEQKSFSFYDKNSIQEPSESENSNKSRVYQKAKTIHRKGESHDIEKDSEDQIEKRLVYLENLLKKGHTEEVSANQSEEEKEKRLGHNGHNDRVEKQFKKSRNIYKPQTEDLGRPSHILKRQVPSKKQPNNNYFELCQKLGKQRLLIEQDQDISALIYQGMANKN